MRMSTTAGRTGMRGTPGVAPTATVRFVRTVVAIWIPALNVRKIEEDLAAVGTVGPNLIVPGIDCRRDQYRPDGLSYR